MPVGIEFADDIYRDRVLRARAMPPEEKLLLGAQIFERVCRIMCDGIRHDFPDADPDEVQRILGERLELARRLEDQRRTLILSWNLPRNL